MAIFSPTGDRESVKIARLKTTKRPTTSFAVQANSRTLNAASRSQIVQMRGEGLAAGSTTPLAIGFNAGQLNYTAAARAIGPHRT